MYIQMSHQEYFFSGVYTSCFHFTKICLNFIGSKCLRLTSAWSWRPCLTMHVLYTEKIFSHALYTQTVLVLSNSNLYSKLQEHIISKLLPSFWAGSADSPLYLLLRIFDKSGDWCCEHFSHTNTFPVTFKLCLPLFTALQVQACILYPLLQYMFLLV